MSNRARGVIAGLATLRVPASSGSCALYMVPTTVPASPSAELEQGDVLSPTEADLIRRQLAA